MTLVPRIMELLAAEGADDVLVIVGGTIPADDADDLRALGVAAVYTPGAPVDDMVSFLEGAVAA
jgi:methylmalonyl-CoA mutase C-terminal domain/subunit